MESAALFYILPRMSLRYRYEQSWLCCLCLVLSGAERPKTLSRPTARETGRWVFCVLGSIRTEETEEIDMATGSSLNRKLWKPCLVVATLLLVLAFTMASEVVFAGDGAAVPPNSPASPSQPAEGHANGSVSRARAEGGPRAEVPDPLAPLLAELQELKDSVQAQARRLDEHTRELAAERAELEGELDHIAKLESELRTAPGEPVAAAAPTEALAPTPAASSIVLARWPFVSWAASRRGRARSGQHRSGASSLAGERRPATERFGATDEETGPAHV